MLNKLNLFVKKTTKKCKKSHFLLFLFLIHGILTSLLSQRKKSEQCVSVIKNYGSCLLIEI